MAKTSIKPPVDGESAPSIERENQLVPGSSTSVGLPTGYNPDQYDDPNRDIQTPALGLINKIGPLSKTFPKNAGEFAFGESVLLGEKAIVIPVAKQKLYIESRRNGKDLKFGDGIVVRVFTSAREAAHAGYAVDFDDKAQNRVEEAAKLGFLVKAPEGDKSGEFYYSAPDGTDWGIAQTTLRRGSYRGVYRLINTRASRPGAKLHDTAYLLFAEHVENAQRQQDWFESRVRTEAQLTPEFIAWIESALSDRLAHHAR